MQVESAFAAMRVSSLLVFIWAHTTAQDSCQQMLGREDLQLRTLSLLLAF